MFTIASLLCSKIITVLVLKGEFPGRLIRRAKSQSPSRRISAAAVGASEEAMAEAATAGAAVRDRV